MLGHPNVLEICYGQLTIEDVEINLITLRFLNQLLELGDSGYGSGENVILALMRSASALFSEISSKSYSENTEISGLSEDIMEILSDE